MSFFESCPHALHTTVIKPGLVIISNSNIHIYQSQETFSHLVANIFRIVTGNNLKSVSLICNLLITFINIEIISIVSFNQRTENHSQSMY